MKNKRILIVDDSSLYQRLLADVINEREGLEVVGVAANGRVALEMMELAKPDLVTLDILMPELDGIQTLVALRKSWPQVRTVMVSSLTSQGSDAALDALALGASDYAEKPDLSCGTGHIRAQLARDLVPRIEALCGVEKPMPGEKRKPYSPLRSIAAPLMAQRAGTSRALELIAIGISTGGPDALAKVLAELPADIGVPIVIVQHMPAEFTGKLARRLNAASQLNVVEAGPGDSVRAGTVYIAPGNLHMVLDRVGNEVVVNLNSDAPENSCRPAVDPLFRSLPAIYGNKVLGVIMTGMGADGVAGCEALSIAGCPIIVQDQETSVVWGMPRLVAMAGLAQQQVPLALMASTITGFACGSVNTTDGTAANSDVHGLNTVSGGFS